MKKWILGLVVGALSIAAFAGGMKVQERHVQIADVKDWMQPFGPQGPSFGFVEGKMNQMGKPATFFIKAPPGFDSGWHIHDNDYQAVVLKGTFTEQQQGDAQETVMPAYTYFEQKGKANHRNGCTKDGDCILMVHFDKGANSIPMTPEGKKLPPPKPADKGDK